ncbi:MAG: exodeoxyribonuclease III [Xanthomonadales bacterium]|jgi:exodeoxyribonuclease-3|nr:exodeoxyribonuclease III [Xanthomonadales bacterium]
MKIATWNVNSLKVRLPQLTDWLSSAAPDLVGLQETKLIDEEFPDDTLAQAGYHVVFSGQKAYNGVALLAREPLTEVSLGPAALDDPAQRRIIAATVGDLRVVNLYVVNGESLDSDKYAYKLRWLAGVRDWLATEIARHPRLVLMGDFNIAPTDLDVHDPAAWHEQVLCSSAERAALAAIQSLGLHDAYRLIHSGPKLYSWWDYRQLGFQKNRGLRIDLILVSEALKAGVRDAGVERAVRKLPRPSDHAPVWVELSP